MENNINDVDVFICVSFVPFLNACNCDYISPELLKEIVSSPNTLSFGCIYDEEKEIFSIIVNMAEKLRNEMHNWSGGDDNYFLVYYNEGEEIADLVISANNDESKKRFVKSMLDNFGKVIEEDSVVCISKFIQCHWRSNLNKEVSKMFSKKLDTGEPLKLSFVDHKDIVGNIVTDVKAYKVGNFKLIKGSPNLLQNPIFGEGKVN